MNIDEILAEYDLIEQTHDLNRIESFLAEHLYLAKEENDQSAIITIYNEMIGFCRENARYDKGMEYCRDLLVLLDEMSIQNTIPYATSLLNIATFCRDAGFLKEANIYYLETLKIYDTKLSPTDIAYASLYNNMALLFEKMGDFVSAIDVLKKAVGLVMTNPEYRIKKAISHTNLAMCLMKNEDYDEACYNLDEAIAIFDAESEVDYHYGAALSAMGEIRFIKGEYAEAAECYKKALGEVKKNTGFSVAYELTYQNLCQTLQRFIIDEGVSDEKMNKMDHKSLVKWLVWLEWEAFDRVQNEGGRASCQNDFYTFNIMRSSQYLTWSDEMIQSYMNDFIEAGKYGWNLITEKYGRMEESTAPHRWNEIKDAFPQISEEKRAIIENIVGVQTGMMEEFAKEYPKASSNTRLIHTSEDTPYVTSYETYLRGEISTYSDQTLLLYGRFIARLAKDNVNLAKLIIENTALMYGYKSIDDMEEKL